VLRSQYLCEQRVLALEVAVKRALRDVGRGGDLVDVDPREALLPKNR
jgi:hypothetical protein